MLLTIFGSISRNLGDIFPGLENIPQLPGNRAEVGQNNDSRNAVSATLSVLKWSGAIFRPTSSKVGVQKVMLSAFQCKPRPSGVSLESPRLENIPKVSWNRAELGLTHDALSRSRLLFQSESEVGFYFGPEATKRVFEKLCFVHFTENKGDLELV